MADFGSLDVRAHDAFKAGRDPHESADDRPTAESEPQVDASDVDLCAPVDDAGKGDSMPTAAAAMMQAAGLATNGLMRAAIRG